MSNREAIYRLIGFWYFPLQMIVVWLVLFGLNAYPSPHQTYIAFGVENIVDEALKFVAFLPFKAFSAGRLLYFVLMLIPNIIILVFSCWRVLLFVFALAQLFCWAFANISILARNGTVLADSARVIFKTGSPGSGKSSSGIYEAINKASKAYKRLRWYHWKYASQVIKWTAEGNNEMLERWREVHSAYMLYNNNPDCIPCLWSNIPLKDLNGSMANELTIDHLYQRERLPAFSVVFIDEVGAMLGVEMSHAKEMLVSLYFRYCRHFGEFYILGTEQEGSNTYIDVRRVVGYTEYLDNQKWVCKPYPLMLLLAPFKALFTKLQKGARRFGDIVGFIDSLINHVGYRKYTFTYEKNQMHRGGKLKGKGVFTYYLPSALNCTYDERTYRKFYKPIDEPLVARPYQSLTLAPQSIYGKRYLNEEQRKEDKRVILQGTAKQLMTAKPTHERAKGILGKFGERDKLVNSMLANEEILNALEVLASAPPPPPKEK